MAYRFKLKEGLQEGVRRIALEQIDKVLETPRKGEDRVVWVHEARKAMKRTRSLLKCVRSGLDPRVFREENAELAGIARALSGLRDRDVMRETMVRLAGQNDDLDVGLAWLGGRLETPETEAAHAPSARSADAAVRRAVKSLEKAQSRLAKLDVAGEVADTVGTGLRASQRNGREVLARLELSASDENVHDLRKAVQTYQRQHNLLQAVWPEMQAIRVEAARELAQQLGEAQDLAVLAATAVALSDGQGDDEARLGASVAEACRERQRLICDVAIPMAERLFALRPKAVEQELRSVWRAAGQLAAKRIPSADKAEKRAPDKRSARTSAE